MKKILQAGAAIAAVSGTPALADSSTGTYKETCVITEDSNTGTIIEDTADMCGDQVWEIIHNDSTPIFSEGVKPNAPSEDIDTARFFYNFNTGDVIVPVGNSNIGGDCGDLIQGVAADGSVITKVVNFGDC